MKARLNTLRKKVIGSRIVLTNKAKDVMKVIRLLENRRSLLKRTPTNIHSQEERLLKLTL